MQDRDRRQFGRRAFREQDKNGALDKLQRLGADFRHFGSEIFGQAGDSDPMKKRASRPRRDQAIMRRAMKQESAISWLLGICGCAYRRPAVATRSDGPALGMLNSLKRQYQQGENHFVTTRRFTRPRALNS
jgi:hypothetical protein